MEDNNQIAHSLLKFKEKRKWQIALRRYVLQNNVASAYAHYFGLDISGFRNWIELQFTDGINWENFGLAWQFDHIVPLAYFDLEKETDLFLCWSFINIRVERLDDKNARSNKSTLLVVRNYFEELFDKTEFTLCGKMVTRIKQMEASALIHYPKLETFLSVHKEKLESLITLSAGEMSMYNQGATLNDILLQKEILKKYG